MCVAELNVSVLPCRHRWFHLVRSCNPSANLANCGSKLGLSGWEIKCSFCPFCAEWNISPSEYRLLGNDRAPAVGGLARTPSLTLTTTRRDSRRGSLSRTDSNTSITQMAQEKNRAMNARVDAYIRVPHPEISSNPAPLHGVAEEDGMALAASPSDSSSEGQESVRQSSTSSQTKAGFLKKVRRKTLNIFK